MKHESHPAVVNRLKRANGHLASIITMIEEGRGCLEIAQQMHAVVQALDRAKSVFIHDHIDHCLEHAAGCPEEESRRLLTEFKQITKYL